MRFVLAILVISSLFLSGCGSKSKKSDSSAETSESKVKSSPKSSPKIEAPKIDKYQILRDAKKSGSHRTVVAAAQKLLEKNPKDVRALNALAMEYYRTKQLGLAKILLSRAFSESPRSAELHNNLGLVQLAELETDEAIRSFRKALGINSNYAAAAANLGALYLHNGDYRKAKVALSSAVKGFDLNYKVQHNYALALFKTGNYETAREHFQKAAELNNTDSITLLNYAILLVEKLKDFKTGREILDKLRFAGISSEMRGRVGDLERMMRAPNGKK